MKQLSPRSFKAVFAFVLWFLFSMSSHAACDFGTGNVGANPAAPLITYTGNDGTISTSGSIPAGIYNFVNFTINAGVTVTVSGGTGPLIIRCTGTANINGVITFDGGNGAQGGIGTFSGGIGGAGGAGANGWGGAGGTGGTAVSSVNGLPGTSFATSNGRGLGGVGAPNSTPFGGGGGGGAGYSVIGIAGTAGDGGAGGLGGSLYGDALLTTSMTQNAITTTLLGGSGGGGGGARGNITYQGGGGGGGGGGAIQITANTINFSGTGLLSVKGGDGARGGFQAGAYGGSGGGGSGGTISLQYLAGINGFVQGTNVNISGGTGPLNGANNNPGKGGNGAEGRIYVEPCGAACPVTISNQSSTNPTCIGSNNGTITITASGGNPLTYTINSGTPLNNQTGVFTGLAPGTYTVSVSDGNCSKSGTSISITNPAPVSIPAASSNSPLCVGDTLKLTASTVANATYTWSGPNGNNFNVQNPSKVNIQSADAGTYSVIATVNGCNSTASGTVSVAINAKPSPPTPAGTNAPICEGDTLKLTSANVANATYSWTGPNTFAVQNPTKANATTADGGTYNVAVTVNGCRSNTVSVPVTVNLKPASPTASSNAPLCEGATLNLTASTVSGATAYNWTGPNNFSNQQNPTKANVTSADGGTYRVVAVQGSCTSAPGTVNVIIAPQPSAPVASSNSPVCEGGTLNLTANNISGATFNWTGPNNFSNQQNPSKPNVTSADSGTYTVIASIGSCVSPPATVTVTVEPSPVLTTVSSNSPVCTGATLNLTTDNIPGASYNWTGPNNFSEAQQNPSRTNITMPDSGDYTVTVTIGNCSATATIQVMVYETPAAPVISASSTTICSGDSIEVCAPTGFASYLWNQNGETTNCGVAKFAGGLWVDVTASNGCSVRSNSLNITTYGVSSVSIIKQGDTLSTFGAVSYQWFKDGVAINGATSPVYIASSPGTYTVQITDANGCKATSTGLVITGLKESAVFSSLEIFPNPTSGQFVIRYSGESLQLVQMTLFNAIGEQVRLQSLSLVNGATIPVDISSLAKGIYLVQLQSGSDQSLRRIVLE